MSKLKVFTWSDGFHAYTVATPSRAKALAAWGVARDLFKDGDAKEIDESDDYDAALAAPGETIKRGLSVDVGRLSRVAKPKASNQVAFARVAALERAFADLVAEHDTAVSRLDEQRSRLDQESEALDRAYDDSSAVFETKLAEARRKLGKT